MTELRTASAAVQVAVTVSSLTNTTPLTLSSLTVITLMQKADEVAKAQSALSQTLSLFLKKKNVCVFL